MAIHKSTTVETAPLFAEALALERNASGKQQVSELINAFKKATGINHESYPALWRTGNYHMLMGAAYSESKKERKYHYNQAIKYCEMAMMISPVFRQKVTNGRKIWDAVDQLDAPYVDAMGYWYTARFYYFKECLSPLGRLFNVKLVLQNQQVISRIDALDRDWAGGGNHMSRGIFYIAAPEKFGGSKIKAAEEFAKAIEAGPNHLSNRWARAKYLYSLTGNKEGYRSDLEWVLAQDPHQAPNTYPWNMYFQAQAKTMLDNINSAFK
jgi:tetratricopeptide (TPR) repeat protein